MMVKRRITSSTSSTSTCIESFIFDKMTLAVLDQVLRELRFPLSAVGLWPLPVPWRIRVVEDELKRKEISQLQLISKRTLPQQSTVSDEVKKKKNNFFSPQEAAGTTDASPSIMQQSSSAFWRDLEGDNDDDDDKTSSRNLDKYFDEIDARNSKQKTSSTHQNPHAKELASLTMEFSL